MLGYKEIGCLDINLIAHVYGSFISPVFDYCDIIINFGILVMIIFLKKLDRLSVSVSNAYTWPSGI